MLLPATTTASSASTCRSWSYHASGPCTSHVQVRLLQLSPCWPANLDTECTPESAERCSATHLSVETSRSRRQFSATVTLATHTVACAVQTMPTYVQSQPWSSAEPKYISDLMSTVVANLLQQHDPACALPKLPTIIYQGFGPSSASEPFRTQDLQRGTSCQKIRTSPTLNGLNENWRRKLTVLRKLLVVSAVTVWLQLPVYILSTVALDSHACREHYCKLLHCSLMSVVRTSLRSQSCHPGHGAVSQLHFQLPTSQRWRHVDVLGW